MRLSAPIVHAVRVDAREGPTARFRPWPFASYNLASAAAMSLSAVDPSAGKTDAPMLIVNGDRPGSGAIASTAARTRSATVATSVACVFGRMATNSSPP